MRDADRAVGLRPSDRWGFWPGWVDLAWAVFALANRNQRLSCARLVVEDTRSGISPAELRHIFDRFRSGPAVGGARGTGLGLALVRAIARGHGGEVRVHSVPGSGSKFEIVLPALAPPDDGPADVLAPTQAGDPCGNVNPR